MVVVLDCWNNIGTENRNEIFRFLDLTTPSSPGDSAMPWSRPSTELFYHTVQYPHQWKRSGLLRFLSVRVHCTFHFSSTSALLLTHSPLIVQWTAHHYLARYDGGCSWDSCDCQMPRIPCLLTTCTSSMHRSYKNSGRDMTT